MHCFPVVQHHTAAIKMNRKFGVNCEVWPFVHSSGQTDILLTILCTAPGVEIIKRQIHSSAMMNVEDADDAEDDENAVE